MSLARRVARSVLPVQMRRHLQDWLRRRRARKALVAYEALPTQDAFTEIYTKGVWGESIDPGQPFFSGEGSHEPALVEGYVRTVSQFLESFPVKPNVLDLGCGDFHVGAKLRPFCGRYVACDIVEPLIAFNMTKYAALGVDFKVLNLATDALPSADVVFVRQVFQHLSNDEIHQALAKIRESFTYLVLTEHLPLMPNFVPNLDKRPGPHIRLPQNSGIVLTAAPFNLRPLEQHELWSLPSGGGIVMTFVYRLR